MTDLGSLYSLGYSGRGSDDLRALLPPGVLVVDVRLQPWGRAPFNGPHATRLLTESVGLAYRWDRRLGNLGYKRGTIEIADIEAIGDVIDDLRAGHSVALLCVCPSPSSCHRSTLAEAIRERLPGVEVVHL